jgi:hypothetical protein
MITPEARERLAEFMDRRRIDLRLTWREVADAGGISYEALRAARNGVGDIRSLTQAGVEDGLQWEHGSVARILAGGDPTPRREGIAIPLPTAAAPPRARQLPVLTLSAEDEAALRPFLQAVRRDAFAVAGLQFGPGREVPELPEVEEHLARQPGARLFRLDHEIKTWDSPQLTTEEKFRLIAVLRMWSAATEVPHQRDAVLTARIVNKSSRSA